MRFSWKTAAAMICSFLGLMGWCYVGGYMILTKPLKDLVLSFAAGDFSFVKILAALVQAFLYLSLAGAVWCIGYMGSDYFKTWEKDSREKKEQA